MDMVLKTTIEQWGSIMSNESVLRGLRAKVKDLAIKKREIDKEVESLHVVIGVFERNEQSQDSLNKDSFGEKIGTAIYGILHNEGGPLHRSEILSRIQEQGIHVGGKNPVNSVGTYLSLDDRFVNVGRSMWDLAEREPESNTSHFIPTTPPLNIPTP